MISIRFVTNTQIHLMIGKTMELVFKIPTFFRIKYGQIEEIDKFCASICELAKGKEYSSKVKRVDIIPAILPDELIQKGKGKEFTKIELKYKALAMCRQMDFESYQNSNTQEKKVLLKKCLVNALNNIKEKIDFDITEFEKDIESVK